MCPKLINKLLCGKITTSSTVLYSDFFQAKLHKITIGALRSGNSKPRTDLALPVSMSGSMILPVNMSECMIVVELSTRLKNYYVLVQQLYYSCQLHCTLIVYTEQLHVIWWGGKGIARNFDGQSP